MSWVLDLFSYPVVGEGGLEPPTFALSEHCSNLLSYTPKSRPRQRWQRIVSFWLHAVKMLRAKPTMFSVFASVNERNQRHQGCCLHQAVPGAAPGYRLKHVWRRVEVPTPTALAAAGFRDRMPRRGRTLQVPAVDCRLPRALRLRHRLTDLAGIRRRSGRERTRTSAGFPPYALAVRCRSRWATRPWWAGRDSNPHVRRH